MRVAIASHGLYPRDVGGMEKHTHLLALHLARKGIETHVIVPGELGSSPPYSTHSIPWPTGVTWLHSNWRFSERVGSWLEQHPVDIAFGQGFNLWAYLRCKTVPTICHPHGLEMYGAGLRGSEWLKAIPFRWVLRDVVKHSNAVVSLGGKLTEILRERVGVPQDRVVEIPNAVDLTEFSKATPSARMPNSFLFVGRLAFNKGIDLLSAAMARLRDSTLTLTIVGDGPERQRVEALAAADHRVHYKGALSGEILRQEYARHEALLFTSRFEGMPTVILEAMASGCAVVATNVGAVEVVVRDGAGRVVEPSAEGLTEGIRAILATSVKAREEMGLKGRQLVQERFSWDRVVDRYLELFDRLLSTRRNSLV